MPPNLEEVEEAYWLGVMSVALALGQEQLKGS